MARDTFTLLYLTCLLVGVSMSQDPNPMANENTNTTEEISQITEDSSVQENLATTTTTSITNNSNNNQVTTNILPNVTNMAIVTNVTTLITQTNITEPPISIVSTTTNNVTSTKQEDIIIVTTDAISIAEEDLSISNDDNTTDHLVTTNVTSEVVTQKSLLPNNITSEDNTILSDDNSSDILLQHGDGNQNDTKFITVGDGDALVMGQETSDVESLRKTLWIVTGALGGVLLLVLILVLALAVAVSRIKSQFTSKRERYVHSSSIEDNNTGAISSPNIRQGRPSPRQEIHAYDNSAFNPGAHEMEERRDRDSKVEVERLGYEMYNGKHENRNPNHSYKMRSERFVERNSMDSFPDSGLRSTQTSTKEVQRKDSRPTATPMYDIGTEIRPTPRYSSAMPRTSTSTSPERSQLATRGSYPRDTNHSTRLDEAVTPMNNPAGTRDRRADRSNYRY